MSVTADPPQLSVSTVNMSNDTNFNPTLFPVQLSPYDMSCALTVLLFPPLDRPAAVVEAPPQSVHSSATL